MATIVDTDTKRTTICPACGYPSTNLCAACSQIPTAVAAYRALQDAVPAVAHANPAA